MLRRKIMYHIKEVIPTVIKDLIKKVYEGRASITQKITTLIITRRENHGNQEIQEECNKYLELLYDKKFEELKNGRLEN